jgi:hypothetical protein
LEISIPFLPLLHNHQDSAEAETNRVERHGGKAMRVFRPKEFKQNL